MAVQPLPALDALADSKTEFFLAASHQLKSPVAVIQWCLQSLLEVPNLPPDQLKLIRRAVEQADGMSNLIRDLLHVFRVSEGKVAIEDKVVEVNALVERCVAALQPKAESKSVHLVRGPEEQGLRTKGTASLIEQVVTNLVDNAIKYTKAGGHVTVKLGREGSFVCLEVADEGIGIAEIEQHRIFSEFFRGSEARDVADGTGLGLVLVKHVVERHGGTVTFESELHRGTTFTVCLPAA